MVASPSPTVLKRYVALELKRLRLAAGHETREPVAKRLRRNVSHVTHLEIMRNLPSAAEVEVLLDFYGQAERIPAFLELVDAARRGRDWFAAFKGTTPGWFDLALATESSAADISSYDAMLPPGLAQTPAVTRAVIMGAAPELAEPEVNRRVEFRQRRQDVLTRQPNPPLVWCVLDESVLLRNIGGPIVWAEQLEHLVKLTELPNVTIQVLPLAVGAHPGISGTVKVMGFPPELEGDPGIAYTEAKTQGHYYETPAEIQEYRTMLQRLQILALKPEETRNRLVRRMEELK